MNDQPISNEVKKAVAMLQDGTYSEENLVARIEQILQEKTAAGDLHKAVVEQLMHAVDECTETERKYKSGHALLSAYRLKKHDLQVKVEHLKNRGYSTARFEKKQEQKNLF